MTSQLETYLTGYNDGFQRALQLMQEIATRNVDSTVDEAQDTAAAVARKDAPPTSAGESVLRGAKQALAHARRRRRKVTPTETRILDFVAANPGCTTADIEAAGIVARATLYRLVTRRWLRRVVDPKPHTHGRPWVHFYPPEPRNGQT